MMNPELKSRMLFAEAPKEVTHTVLKLVLLTLSLALGCKRGTDAPRARPAIEPKVVAQPVAAPLPLLPKQPPVVGRPPNMPCWIIKKDALPSGEFDGRATIYELSYGQNGRLEAATQWPMKPYCVGEGEDNCVELHGDPEPSLQYQYDAGRLVGVTAARDAGRTAQMRINYDASGRPDRYAWSEQTPNEPVSSRETTIVFDAAGHPVGEITKGKAFKKRWRQSLSFARLEGKKGVTSPPVVWPDSPATLYLGWTYKEDLGKVEGFGIAEGDEIVRIDDAGRIRNRTVSFRGKLHSVRVFSYECPKEGEFKRIPWKTWVPSDAPDVLPPRSGGLHANRATLLGR